MYRPITLASGQFGDLSLEKLCSMAQKAGYDGIELATHAHFQVEKALTDNSYIPYVKETLNRYNLKCFALSAHLAGQCVGDDWYPRLNQFVPAAYAGNSDKIREWAVKEMIQTAYAAQKMGIPVVNGFMGSPIWSCWYSFPNTSPQIIEDGFQKIHSLWSPIFDIYDECGIRFALEVHPTEIAFDYYTAKYLLDIFDNRLTLGFNYDPSHLLWQGVSELLFLQDFAPRIYHVHMKDVKMNADPRAGILGSHLPFGDTRRKWNFVSVGHGDVDFDGIIRELNAMNYQGPLSVEWEDSGMEREFGITESYEYIKKMNFYPSSIAFDTALKTK